MVTTIKQFKENINNNNISNIISKYSNISTIEEVKSFFSTLYNDLDLSFHPDDHFDSYGSNINNEWVELFTSEEADKLDNIMHECFKICYQNNIDIYMLGLIAMGHNLSKDEDLTIEPDDIDIYKKILNIK